MAESIRGTRYTVMGLGVLGGGVGVARYLASRGGIVTVTDMRDEAQLQSSINLLSDLPITYHLGGHDDADFTLENADVVVRNPGVRRNSPYLQLARQSGVRVEMEMSLFFRACRAPVLGITGTKGKTSVSTLCGLIMQTWNAEAVLAGNMGISALALVDDILPEHPVVIELSSWQLEAMDEHALGPKVAVLTNISPDHLDAYDSFDDYADTKRTIARHVPEAGVVVYNHDDPECRKIVGQTNASLLPFGLHDPGTDGAWLAGDELVLRMHGEEVRIARPTQLQLSGEHGTSNALAAFAASWAYGAPVSAIEQGIREFSGVPNRMEEVATVNGILFINDTSATAPVAAINALRVLSGRARELRLIAGGSDKRTDLTPFADEIALRRPRVYLLDGTATPTLAELLKERDVSFEGPYPGMESVFNAAVQGVEQGDIVTLTPGCASFGLFRNEFDRGEQFRAAVNAYASRAGAGTAGESQR
jgi:UDP-N-acetylmuramoylalanine--D-glutamate ligase